MADRVSKKTAHYRDKPNGNERCGKCKMFREPDRCSAVIGEISPSGWCKYFERKARNWYGDKSNG